MAKRIVASPIEVQNALVARLNPGNQARAYMSEFVRRGVYKNGLQDGQGVLEFYCELFKQFLEAYIAPRQARDAYSSLAVLNATVAALFKSNHSIAFFVTSQILETKQNLVLDDVLSLDPFFHEQVNWTEGDEQWLFDEFPAHFILSQTSACSEMIPCVKNFFKKSRSPDRIYKIPSACLKKKLATAYRSGKE